MQFNIKDRKLKTNLSVTVAVNPAQKVKLEQDLNQIANNLTADEVAKLAKAILDPSIKSMAIGYFNSQG